MGNSLKNWEKHLLEKRRKALNDKAKDYMPASSLKCFKQTARYMDQESKNRFLAKHISSKEIDLLTEKDFE